MHGAGAVIAFGTLSGHGLGVLGAGAALAVHALAGSAAREGKGTHGDGEEDRLHR